MNYNEIKTKQINQVTVMLLERGDILVLGSDGLFDSFAVPRAEHVANALLKSLLCREGNLTKAVEDIVREAELSALCCDNVTMVAVACR